MLRRRGESRFRFNARVGLAFLAAAGWLSGCLHFVQVEVRLRKPSRYPMAQIGTLALLGAPDTTDQRDASVKFLGLLIEEIRTRKQLSIVDSETVSREVGRANVRPADLWPAEVSHQIGEALHADAVLVIEMQSANVSTVTEYQQEERHEYVGDELVPVIGPGGTAAYVRQPVYHDVQESIPIQVRRAQVHLSVRLTRLSTGVLLAADQISRESPTPERATAGELSKGPSSDQMLQDLLTSTAREVADDLTAHAETVPRDLMRGGGRTGKGVEAAVAGDWDRAEQLWEEAIAKDPRDAAALHNRAVAAEREGDFETAIARLRFAEVADPKEPSHRRLREQIERELTEAEAAH